jgi:hypothetical protein
VLDLLFMADRHLSITQELVGAAPLEARGAQLAIAAGWRMDMEI